MAAGRLIDKAGFRSGSGAFAGHRNQGRLGNGCTETQGESEQEQPEEAALAREFFSQRFAEGKQADVQTNDKERQPDDDQTQSGQDGDKFREGLSQDQNLEQGNDQNNGRQITACAKQGAAQGFHYQIHMQPACVRTKERFSRHLSQKAGLLANRHSIPGGSRGCACPPCLSPPVRADRMIRQIGESSLAFPRFDPLTARR